MKIEELVPDIKLCELIPEGEFSDSCFVRIGTDTIIPRSDVRIVNGKMSGIYPAPTLEEIMAKLPPLQEVFRDEFDHGKTLWTTDWGNYSKNATETALRSWFYQKGIEYEK